MVCHIAIFCISGLLVFFSPWLRDFYVGPQYFHLSLFDVCFPWMLSVVSLLSPIAPSWSSWLIVAFSGDFLLLDVQFWLLPYHCKQLCTFWWSHFLEVMNVSVQQPFFSLCAGWIGLAFDGPFAYSVCWFSWSVCQRFFGHSKLATIPEKFFGHDIGTDGQTEFALVFFVPALCSLLRNFWSPF